MNKIIIVEGHKYMVTEQFNHPGEGIRDVYLRTLTGDQTEDFNHYHMTNEPWEILEKVRALGVFKGIYYKGPV